MNSYFSDNFYLDLFTHSPIHPFVQTVFCIGPSWTLMNYVNQYRDEVEGGGRLPPFQGFMWVFVYTYSEFWMVVHISGKIKIGGGGVGWGG